MMIQVTFYKVLLIRCSVLESEIVDERHFDTLADAKAFADLHENMISCIIEM